MITYFYKIINDKNIPIYIGLTTRDINIRFKEHCISKNLNSQEYFCVEIDRIVHLKITSLEDFYREANLVRSLERKYIKEYTIKYNLLNKSKGGEWGTKIYDRLIKKAFFKKYKSYENFEKQFKEFKKFKSLLKHWIFHRISNKTKGMLKHWILHRSSNKTKMLLSNWISVKSRNKSKVILRNWILNRTKNKTKRILKTWIFNKTKNLTKNLINHWVSNKKLNKTKILLNSWIRLRK